MSTFKLEAALNSLHRYSSSSPLLTVSFDLEGYFFKLLLSDVCTYRQKLRRNGVSIVLRDFYLVVSNIVKYIDSDILI